MAEGNGGWLPPWFEQWLAAVYLPQHTSLENSLKQLTEAAQATAQAVQRIELSLATQANRSKKLDSYVREWAPAAVVAIIGILDLLKH